MSEREDYADNELPQPKRPSVQFVVAIVIVLILVIFIGLPLLARIIASQMEWS